MKTITEQSREIPVRWECDVLVAGGGTAGCAAAVSAARAGAKVILIEELPTLGGTLGNGGLVANSFYSSYTTPDVPIKKVVRGFAEEFIDEMQRCGGTPGYTKVDPTLNPYHRPYIVIVDHEMQKMILAKMLMEAGVTVLLHTFLCGVQSENGELSAAIVESKSGREAIHAKCFIDCTGDGDLAIMGGAQWRTMYDRYRVAGNVGMPFGMGNVDLKSFYEFASKNGIVIKEDSWHDNGMPKGGIVRLKINFKANPEISQKFSDLGLWGMFLVSMHHNEATYINMLGDNKINVNDVEQLSETEMRLRVYAMEASAAFKKYLGGFENSHLNWQAVTLGIRGSRIILCDYSLTNEAIVHSARFCHEIGLFGFNDFAPIGEEWVLRDKGYYGMPYEMLLPRGLKNVWAAGRHITEEFEAQMSTRNTVNCMVQGQAAGIAAALCARGNLDSRSLPYETLREKLLEANVCLE